MNDDILVVSSKNILWAQKQLKKKKYIYIYIRSVTEFVICRFTVYVSVFCDYKYGFHLLIDLIFLYFLSDGQERAFLARGRYRTNRLATENSQEAELRRTTEARCYEKSRSAVDGFKRASFDSLLHRRQCGWVWTHEHNAKLWVL